MLNVLAGFEQANTYIIHGINGSTVGRIVEENTTVYLLKNFIHYGLYGNARINFISSLRDNPLHYTSIGKR